MNNLLRYGTAEDSLDDLFRGLFMRPVKFAGQSEIQIKIDVAEDQNAYTVHAEVPGVKKEDIQVTVDGAQVSISAEVKTEKEVKEGSRVLRNERYFGSVSRSFTLGQEIDDSAVSAKYVDGVLELVLPKRTVAKSKRIAIE